MHELLKERVIKPISDAELERRWKAVREFEIGAVGRFKAKMMGAEQLFIQIGSAPPGKNFPYSHINRKF